MNTNGYTLEERATNYETLRHIERVRNLLNYVIKELLERAEQHDQSKMERPEVSLFTEMTDKLATCTYGSDEYEGYRKKLKPALEHHYARNRHHPEHFAEGIKEMNLIDLLEMLVDWKSSSERHHDGNIRKSIDHNSKRFDMSAQLTRIFHNTADFLDGA